MNDQTHITTLVSPESEPCTVGKHRIPLGVGGRTALLLARVGAVLSEIADERLGDAELSGSDYAILAILTSDEPGSQHELAELMGKAPGIIVAAIDGLEQRELVARVRDPSDRRRSRVTLTPAGKRALARADALAEKAVEEMFGGLDERQRDQLGELLETGLQLRAP
jgi:DNA-binding MarR family transcriptional regulator